MEEVKVGMVFEIVRHDAELLSVDYGYETDPAIHTELEIVSRVNTRGFYPKRAVQWRIKGQSIIWTSEWSIFKSCTLLKADAPDEIRVAPRLTRANIEPNMRFFLTSYYLLFDVYEIKRNANMKDMAIEIINLPYRKKGMMKIDWRFQNSESVFTSLWDIFKRCTCLEGFFPRADNSFCFSSVEVPFFTIREGMIFKVVRSDSYYSPDFFGKNEYACVIPLAESLIKIIDTSKKQDEETINWCFIGENTIYSSKWDTFNSQTILLPPF